MRLLMVGSDKVYAIENYYKKYLQELGVEVQLFTAQNYFYAYYQKSVINKILYRASLSGIIHKINRLFKENVEAFQPDVIWIFKGMEITPSSLVWARSKHIRLVNYNPDNPFIFTGRGSGNSNVTNSISLYDLQLTYNLKVKDKLEKDFHVKTAMLPFGYDFKNELYELAANQQEISRVCFAGNPDAERSAFIGELADAGIEIDLYGNGWDKYLNQKSVRIFPAIYGDEFWKILRRYRVQLNLMRLHNLDSHNMRSFEVPAIGGIMLAPDTPEHRIFFKNQVEVFLFTTVQDCIQLARTLIAMPEKEADGIRQNARSRSLESGYSYKSRSNTVFQELKKLLS